MKIFKYPITRNGGFVGMITMPTNAKILSVQTQISEVVLWAEVNPENPPSHRYFEAVPTGGEVPKGEHTYLGTIQLAGGLYIYHIYGIP